MGRHKKVIEEKVNNDGFLKQPDEGNPCYYFNGKLILKILKKFENKEFEIPKTEYICNRVVTNFILKGPKIIYYCINKKTGVIYQRRSVRGVRNLTGCTLAFMKELI